MAILFLYVVNCVLIDDPIYWAVLSGWVASMSSNEITDTGLESCIMRCSSRGACWYDEYYDGSISGVNLIQEP